MSSGDGNRLVDGFRGGDMPSLDVGADDDDNDDDDADADEEEADVEEDGREVSGEALSLVTAFSKDGDSGASSSFVSID